MAIPFKSVALTALVVVAAACGSNAAASNHSSSAKSVYRQQLAFAQCMRSNGVSGFPDPAAPSSNGGGGGFTFNNAGAGSNAQFQQAQQACKSYLPSNSGKSPGSIPQNDRQALLKFSSCMRSHGIPDFPDPNFNSGSGMDINGGQHTSSDLDPSNPQFQKAMQACQSNLPNAGQGSPIQSGSGG